MIARAALIAAALLPFAASPAAAQETPNDLMNVSLASVLAVCVGAVDGKVDLNDRAALAVYHLAPMEAEAEARMSKGVPGMEMAGATLADGQVMVGLAPGPVCSVQIDGGTRIAVRDALVQQLLDTNVRATRSTSPHNDDVLIFHFTAYAIYVLTSPRGSVMVQVRRP